MGRVDVASRSSNPGARPLCRRWNRGNYFYFVRSSDAPTSVPVAKGGAPVLYLCCEERRARSLGSRSPICDFHKSRGALDSRDAARGAPARPRPAQRSADTRASRISRRETLGGNARVGRGHAARAAAELWPQVQLGQRLPDGRIRSVSHVLREQRHDVPRLLRALDAQDV